MAWERRGKKQYFYRSVRQENSVRKLYLGTGEQGRQAAEDDGIAHEARRQAKQLRAEQIQPMDELVVLIAEFGAAVDKVVDCQLIAAGWRRHNRAWRQNNGRRRKQKR